MSEGVFRGGASTPLDSPGHRSHRSSVVHNRLGLWELHSSLVHWKKKSVLEQNHQCSLGGPVGRKHEYFLLIKQTGFSKIHNEWSSPFFKKQTNAAETISTSNDKVYNQHQLQFLLRPICIHWEEAAQ